MIDTLVTIAATALWTASASGWAFWVTVHALVAPWRFLP